MTAPGTKAEIYRLETVKRTTYTDLLTVSAGASTNPYNGIWRGNSVSATDYWDASGVLTNQARIGTIFNDNSVDRFGGSLFFDVSPLDDGVLSRAMTIKYDGNVGIGTTSPGGTLHVSNASSSNALFCRSAAPPLTVARWVSAPVPPPPPWM